MTEEQVQILVIEKDKTWAEEIRRAFEASEFPFNLTIADDIIAAQNILAQSSPDLVIAELPLPQKTDLQLLVYKGRRDFAPLVALVERENEKLALEAIDRGALDYIVKSKTAIKNLPRVAKRALREWEHIFERMQTEEALEIVVDKLAIKTAELKDANAQLEMLSYSDEFTDLYNQKYLLNILKKEFNRAERYRRDLALLLIVIDKLEQIVEKFDQTCGRIIIQDVAELLKKNVRSADILTRYGQDGYAVILPEISIQEVFEVAEKLRLAVWNHPYEYRGQPVEVTISIGATAHSRNSHESWQKVLNTADQALDHARKSGTNRVVAQR